MEKIKHIDNGNNFGYFSVKKDRGEKLFFQVGTIDPNAFFFCLGNLCLLPVERVQDTRGSEEIARVRDGTKAGKRGLNAPNGQREGWKGVERTKSAWGRRPFVVGAACVRQGFSTTGLTEGPPLSPN